MAVDSYINFISHGGGVLKFITRTCKICPYKILLFVDSLYFALSGKTLDDVIRPELREEWEEAKRKWFPRTDTPENIAFDKRTPGTVR